MKRDAIERGECEALLLSMLSDAWHIYSQYRPGGQYLSMTVISEDGKRFLRVNNAYYDDDEDRQICVDMTEVEDNDSI